jgi:hypothetical protein
MGDVGLAMFVIIVIGGVAAAVSAYAIALWIGGGRRRETERRSNENDPQGVSSEGRSVG